jgi:hypothetical protein
MNTTAAGLFPKFSDYFLVGRRCVRGIAERAVDRGAYRSGSGGDAL